MMLQIMKFLLKLVKAFVGAIAGAVIGFFALGLAAGFMSYEENQWFWEFMRSDQ